MRNLLALILGCTFAVIIATLFFNKTNSYEEDSLETMSDITTKAFQIGAFTSEESAATIAYENNAILVQDGDLYFVYKSILNDNEVISKMEDYLKSSGVHYYMKVISTSDQFKDELVKYEEMMKKTNSDVAFLELNKRILDKYEETK